MPERPAAIRPPLPGARVAGWLAAAVLAAGLQAAAPARAGLLGPVLQLMRPQLERRLTDICVNAAAGGQESLKKTLSGPCRQVAGPASQCLIKEAETSGRSFGVITEMLAGRVGDDSEVVIKRCAARLLGLPSDALKDVPLRDLQQRFGLPSG